MSIIKTKEMAKEFKEKNYFYYHQSRKLGMLKQLTYKGGK